MRRREIKNNLKEQLAWLQKSQANIPPKRENRPKVSKLSQSTPQLKPSSTATTTSAANPPPPAAQLTTSSSRLGGGNQPQLTGSTLVVSGQDRSGDNSAKSTSALNGDNNNNSSNSKSQPLPPPQRSFATPTLPQRLNSTAGPSGTTSHSYYYFDYLCGVVLLTNFHFLCSNHELYHQKHQSPSHHPY